MIIFIVILIGFLSLFFIIKYFSNNNIILLFYKNIVQNYEKLVKYNLVFNIFILYFLKIII